MDDGDSRTTTPGEMRAGPPDRRPPDGRIVEDDGDWSAFAPAEAAVMAAARVVSDAPELAFGPRRGDGGAVERRHRPRSQSHLPQQDKPTNVLSFPAPALPAGAGPDRRPLGDIVLAAETVAQEAQAQGISPTHHLQHLVVHGLLHLLGFDHLSRGAGDRDGGARNRCCSHASASPTPTRSPRREPEPVSWEQHRAVHR